MPTSGDALLRLVIPGPPVGKAPARTFRVGGRTVTTTPPKTRAWQTEAGLLARQLWASLPALDAPVVVDVVAVFQRPGRLLRKSSPIGRIPAPCKPDADNIIKAALDACTRAGVWRDDSRVVDVRCRKFYSALGEPASVEITVWLAEAA